MSRALRLLLGSVVLLAVTGCCEVLHLGWAHGVGPRSWRELRPVTRAIAAAGSTDEQGYYDEDTCEAACVVQGGTTVEACYPVTVAPSVASSRAVECRYPGSPFTDQITLPATELQSLSLRPFDQLPNDFCRRACTRPGVDAPECTLVPVRGPAPRPDQPFVVCELYRGYHCSGPSLSQAGSSLRSH